MADSISRALWVGDVFSKERFDSLSIEELDKLFEPPPEYADLTSRSNHFLLGAKGSGKSTLLRSLTLPMQLKRSAKPAYAGVYLGLRFEVLSSLRTATAETGNTFLFEHFFVLSVLTELTRQWSGLTEQDKLLAEIISPLVGDETSDAATLLARLTADRNACHDAAKQRPLREFRDLDLSCSSPLTLESLITLAELASGSCLLTLCPEGRIGLLVDSLDHYGELIPTLFPLFESDAGHSLVVKAAARTLDLPHHQRLATSRHLELHRDFELLSLDRDPDAREHSDLIRNALIRRVRMLGPSELTTASDDAIMRILFGEGEDGTVDVAAFDEFVRTTSGNILTAIILLDRAATEERKPNPGGLTTLTSISAGSRRDAIRSLSREYWQYEIGQIAPDRTRELRALCEVMLERPPTNPSAPHHAPRFKLDGIPDDELPLVRRLIAERLFLLLDAELHELVQSGYGDIDEVRFELNRALLAEKGISPFPGPTYAASWDDLSTRAREKAASKIGRHPRTRAEPPTMTLFVDAPPVFISRSLDRARATRVQPVKSGLEKLFWERNGRKPQEREAWIDVDCIPNAGQFRRDIRAHIVASHYVIADVTDGSAGPTGASGVFFEIGLALAAGRVLGLFHNARAGDPKAPLRIEMLPHVLTSRTVLVHKPGTANFLRDSLQPWDAALRESVRSAAPHSPPVGAPYVYVSIQPRNQGMSDTILSALAAHFPDTPVRVRTDSPEDLDELRDLIAGATVRVVDASGGTSQSSLELGLAAFDTGTGMPSPNTLMIFDAASGTTNPVAMYPGERLPWRGVISEDERGLRAFLQTVGRERGLGWQ